MFDHGRLLAALASQALLLAVFPQFLSASGTELAFDPGTLGCYLREVNALSTHSGEYSYRLLASRRDVSFDDAIAELKDPKSEIRYRFSDPGRMDRALEKAGKTGTTNDNRDGWFAGFTPAHVVVAWVGFDQNVPLGAGRTGGKSAGPIWADFVSRVWSAEPAEQRELRLTPPADYVLVAVNPADGSILDPGQPGWLEPPHWRVIGTSEYRERTATVAQAQ